MDSFPALGRQPLATNPTSVENPQAPIPATGKQAGLNKLSAALADDLSGSFQRLHEGLSKKTETNNEPDGIQNLFKNQRTFSFLQKKCTESGSLALVAFALKVFGAKILDGGGRHIDMHKLEMAMNMLFGKDMHSIKDDVMGYASKIRLTEKEGENGCKLTSNRGYTMDVTLPHFDMPKNELEKFVNVENMHPHYFQRDVTQQDAVDFFGIEDSIPTDLAKLNTAMEERPVSFRRNQDPTTKLKAMCDKMTKGAEIYSRTTKTIDPETGAATTDTQSLKFLVDSAPSLLRDHRDELGGTAEGRAMNELPVNVSLWKNTSQVGEGPIEKSRVVLCGSQFTGSADENSHHAKAVLDGIVAEFSPTTAKKENVVLLDLRFLNAKKFTGKEINKYTEHKDAFETACASHGNRSTGTRITYVSIFQTAQGRLQNMAPGFTPPLTTPAHSDDEVGTPKEQVSQLFYGLPKEAREKYDVIHRKWRALYDKRDSVSNTIPFLTLTKILANVFNDSFSRTVVVPMFGCKSCKDRGPAALTGMVLLEPMIMNELNNPSGPIKGGQPTVNLDRFLGTHLDYESLSSGEKLHLKKQFDSSLVQALNIKNSGMATNKNIFLLTEYFREVDFIHECVLKRGAVDD